MSIIHSFLFRPAQMVDPRYSNPDIRKKQAEKYLNYLDGRAQLTEEEHQLIPQQCYYEIQEIYAWNALTSIERAICRACHPFFSRLPNDRKSVVRICGASMISVGAILLSSYSSNDKLAVIAVIGFIAVLCNEMYRKKCTKE